MEVLVLKSGCQKLDQDGSNTPAPGTTNSTLPNSLTTLSKAFSNCPQSVTSVFWNTARALLPPPFTPLPLLLPFVEVDGAEEFTSASASGRSWRSATRTLQLFARRSLLNARQMPEPPPVTRAVLPETWSAILKVWIELQLLLLCNSVCDIQNYVCSSTEQLTGKGWSRSGTNNVDTRANSACYE